jgi:hypothetical protein
VAACLGGIRPQKYGYKKEHAEREINELSGDPKAQIVRVSRTITGAARVNRTTSSPVTVLMSWRRLTTFMAVMSRTMGCTKRQ